MKLDVGQTKVTMPDGPPCKVTGVFLKGLRRPSPLIEMGEEVFSSFAAEMRGVPTYWCRVGNEIRIWPSPQHTWEIEIDTIDKPLGGENGQAVG